MPINKLFYVSHLNSFGPNSGSHLDYPTDWVHYYTDALLHRCQELVRRHEEWKKDVKNDRKNTRRKPPTLAQGSGGLLGCI